MILFFCNLLLVTTHLCAPRTQQSIIYPQYVKLIANFDGLAFLSIDICWRAHHQQFSLKQDSHSSPAATKSSKTILADPVIHTHTRIRRNDISILTLVWQDSREEKIHDYTCTQHLNISLPILSQSLIAGNL